MVYDWNITVEQNFNKIISLDGTFCFKKVTNSRWLLNASMDFDTFNIFADMLCNIGIGDIRTGEYKHSNLGTFLSMNKTFGSENIRVNFVFEAFNLKPVDKDLLIKALTNGFVLWGS